jgi:hypothetical protein
MKTFKLLVSILLVGFFLSSCLKDPEHSIRVKNEYKERLLNLSVGSVNYGGVNPGATSGYKPVDEGSHTLSGTTTSSQTLTGTASVTGKGSHKWTMKILSSGGLEIKED